MMYNELLTLTDGKATYEQFTEIEAVYMSKEAMTKEQAARLWKRRYGEKIVKPLAEEMRRVKESMEYNNPCEGCGEIVPIGEGVHYKEEGYTLCWKCACGGN